VSITPVMRHIAIGSKLSWRMQRFLPLNSHWKKNKEPFQQPKRHWILLYFCYYVSCIDYHFTYAKSRDWPCWDYLVCFLWHNFHWEWWI